jgi:hypothetical protein
VRNEAAQTSVRSLRKLDCVASVSKDAAHSCFETHRTSGAMLVSMMERAQS